MSRALLALALIGCGRIGFDPSGDEPATVQTARGRLARGGDHACALRGEEVWCWGDGREGQTGTGSAGVAPTPVLAIDLPAAKYVAAGRLDSCAISLTGDVYCWGYNAFKQAGPQMMKPSPRVVPFEDAHPDKIPGLPGPAIEVSVAADHACALIEDGTVACWGRDNTGQLGRGEMIDDGFDAAPVPGLANIVHISMDDDTSCAVDTAGKLWCWGDNFAGQLGDGMTAPRAVPFEHPTLTGQDVSVGADHTCVLMADGHVACWGSNNSSELGNNDTGQSFTPILSVKGGYVGVDAGDRHTCAITSAGDLECWGFDYYGEAGSPSFNDVGSPTQVAGISNVALVSAGGSGTCALTTDGKTKCWGLSRLGQNGDGTMLELGPQPVMGVSGVNKVVVGETSTCTLSSGGVIQCWGENWAGQLGDGTNQNTITPVTTQTPWTGTARDLVAGLAHVCARIDTGEVWCWGLNDGGQLGDGTIDARNVPVRVGNLPVATEVAAGRSSTCALAGTEILCWGANDHGQLGNNSMTDSGVPVSVGFGFSSVAMGTDHVCGNNTSSVQCWGGNSCGQIGDGGSTDQTTPFSVGTAATALWAGGFGTCANSNTGIKCWGSNDFDMLQVGSGISPSVPTMSTLPASAAIGNSVVCFPAGTDIQCVGNNADGLLGDGSFDSRETLAPTRPTGGTPAQLSIGSYHACARLVDGTVACWGDNTYGQIGNGTQTRSATPSTVAFP